MSAWSVSGPRARRARRRARSRRRRPRDSRPSATQHPDGLDRVQRDAVRPRHDRRGRPAPAGPGTSPRAARASPPRRAGRGPGARKLRLPAPQPGRRSRSSGRASVTMRIGTSRLHSRTWSMKSSMPVSAQWRSSNSSTTVPVAASRSKNVRQAANSSSRPPAGAHRRPAARAGRARSGAFRLVGDVLARASRRSARGSSPRRRSRAGRPRPDHLAQRPERDPLAVRRRAALVPPDVLDDAVDVLAELPRETALADAGLAR